MPTLATLFRAFVTVLCVAIGDQAARDRARNALFLLVGARIDRMIPRLEKLYSRFLAGTLPGPRPSRAGRAAGPPPQQHPPRQRLPTSRAWLLRAACQGPPNSEANGSLRLSIVVAGSRLAHLLARPDMAEFLRAAPQAGRILRPLWHMLSPDPLPPLLHLPPRPARARPARVRPARVGPTEVTPAKLPRPRAARASFPARPASPAHVDAPQAAPAQHVASQKLAVT